MFTVYYVKTAFIKMTCHIILKALNTAPATTVPKKVTGPEIRKDVAHQEGPPPSPAQAPSANPKSSKSSASVSNSRPPPKDKTKKKHHESKKSDPRHSAKPDSLARQSKKEVQDADAKLTASRTAEIKTKKSSCSSSVDRPPVVARTSSSQPGTSRDAKVRNSSPEADNVSFPADANRAIRSQMIEGVDSIQIAVPSTSKLSGNEQVNNQVAAGSSGLAPSNAALNNRNKTSKEQRQVASSTDVTSSAVAVDVDRVASSTDTVAPVANSDASKKPSLLECSVNEDEVTSTTSADEYLGPPPVAILDMPSSHNSGNGLIIIMQYHLSSKSLSVCPFWTKLHICFNAAPCLLL